jgi:hypothetical protein
LGESRGLKLLQSSGTVIDVQTRENQHEIGIDIAGSKLAVLCPDHKLDVAFLIDKHRSAEHN